MTLNKLLIVILLFYGLTLFGQTNKIKVNQVGYYTEGYKYAAIVETQETTFEIQTLAGETVYSGNLSNASNWNETSESVRTINFSDFTQAGSYKIVVPNEGESFPFMISSGVLNDVSKESVRYFYYNRCSYPLEEQYAGIYQRTGGHWDTEVVVCDNPFSEGNPQGTIVSSPGGWYDAGDYNKYLLTAGISTYTLMSAYEQYPDYVSRMNLNIPESNNQIPDLLDECLFELRWLFTMQDTDGGVYTKLTNAGFGGMQMPDVHDDANGPRYVCRKNTSAGLQFVAAMASAYRIYEPIDELLPGFRDSCLNAAIAAWDWCVANPNVDAGQCDCSITTGGYGDNNQNDEFIWAACEMYLATGDIGYYTSQNIAGATLRTPDWGGNKESLGYISLLLNRDRLTGQALSDLPQLEIKFRNLVNDFVSQYNSNPYKIIKSGNWMWGSNGDAGNQSFLTLTAYTLWGDDIYLEAGLSNIDYILGKNTTDYCFITGFGSQKVYNAHHRISRGDNISDPVPGMVFGGPYQQADNFMIENWPTGSSEYAMTEVTINWNAPFAFSTVAVQALMSSNCDRPNLGEDFTICDESVTFPMTLHSGITEGTISWYKNGELIAGAQDSVLEFSVADNSAGIYTIEYELNGCINSDMITISDQIPQPDLGDDRSLEGTSMILDASITGQGYIYSWYNDNVLIEGANSQTLEISEINHTYKVEVSTENCVAVFDEVRISNEQFPFNGDPIQIPGIVEAEEYDIQYADGLAYYDTDNGNSGGEFRDDDVDIEACNQGGYNLGYINNGEWLEYTVDIQTNGYYTISFDIASQMNTGTFHLEIDNEPVTEGITIANAGSTNWQDWQTVEISNILLPAGIKVLKIVFDIGALNFDKMTFTLDEAIVSNQSIALTEGWNWVSFYVLPNDRSVESIFSDNNISIIKTSEEHFLRDQPAFLNSLTEINAGQGYLVYAEAAVNISLEGSLVENNIMEQIASLPEGWHFIGLGSIPQNTDNLPVDVYLVRDNTTVWQRDNSAQPMDLEPGKGYFILK